MRLKNKKTGEIVEKFPDKFVINSGEQIRQYNSLAELNAEWCDVPEEPKWYWYINCFGKVLNTLYNGNEWDEQRKLIGNYFETREEAELAVRKLKAWKRLKDKGFRFDGWEDLQAEMSIEDLMPFNRDVINTDNVIGFRMDDYHDCIKDLNTCFGGEE